MRAGAFGLLAGLILPAVLPAGELPPAHSLDDLVLEAEIPISGNVWSSASTPCGWLAARIWCGSTPPTTPPP